MREPSQALPAAHGDTSAAFNPGGYARFEERARQRRLQRRIDAARAAIAERRIADAEAAIGEIRELSSDADDLPVLITELGRARRSKRGQRRRRLIAASAALCAAMLAPLLVQQWPLSAPPFLTRSAAPPQLASAGVADEVPELPRAAELTSASDPIASDAIPVPDPQSPPVLQTEVYVPPPSDGQEAPRDEVVLSTATFGRVADADRQATTGADVTPPIEASIGQSTGRLSPSPPETPPPVPQPAETSVRRPAETPSPVPAPALGQSVAAVLSDPLPAVPPAPPPPPVPAPRAADDIRAAAATRPAAGAVAAPAAVDEQARVQDALRRYQRAYSALDVSAAQAVWPAVDRAALARAFDGLASQTLTFENCDVRVDGNAAAAMCRGTTQYVPKVGSRAPRVEPRRWSFALTRDASDWKIESARAER